MRTMQSRRDFLATLSAAGATGVLGLRRSLADEGPPEITTIRLSRDPNICLAPLDISGELLRAEGFTDIDYISGGPIDSVALGELDFDYFSAPMVVSRLDAGQPIVALAGVHSGCYELFAHAPIQTISV
jgi:NitT/TauT family transport system substrate-binding protein